MTGHFVDDDHALGSGMILGTLLLGTKDTHGVDVIPMLDADGNYTRKILVSTLAGKFVLTIEPYIEPVDEFLALRDRLD